MGQYEVTVAAIRVLTPTIRELLLRSKDGSALQSYAPGAHIEIDVETGTRPYSLLGGMPDADDPPDTYRIMVERRPEGTGGSLFLCDKVAVGATLGISAPRNNFALDTHPANRLLIAGGIGIAPIYAMARQLKRLGRPFDLVYVARDADQMAYRDEIAAVSPNPVLFHIETAEAASLDVKPLFKKLVYPSEVYVCGTHGLNKAVVAVASANGLSRLQTHEQCFAPPPVVVLDNAPFEVLLRLTGVELKIPADATILETMLANGITPKFYCGRGECGICPMTVVSADGPLEHRDHVLKPAEKESGKRICICVSRVKGSRLVLDA